MTTRDVFLNRVRQAALQGRAHRVHLRPIPEGVGYLGAGGDLCERLALEVSAVGGQAVVASDLTAARTHLQALLAEAGAQSAVVWQHEVLVRLGLEPLLSAAGIAFWDYSRMALLSPEERKTRLLACDIGITSCDAAIAETGTLMMCAGAGHERLASLLPPMHVAIVERRQIVPDLLDAFALLGARSSDAPRSGGQAGETPPAGSAPIRLPSNVTFITGPSKTGDIELQLTTGVHGPGKWRVIIVAGGG